MINRVIKSSATPAARMIFKSAAGDVNLEERWVIGVASTPALDRAGDIIDASGWSLENYKKNPVILWSHDTSIPAIARATEIWLAGDDLLFKAQFPPAGRYPFADTIFGLYAGGFLKAFSVGFDPIESEPRTAPVGGEAVRVGTHYHKQELYEISCVNLPANPEALTEVAKALDLSFDSQPLEAEMEFLKKLAALLGLNPEATEEQVHDVIEKMQSLLSSVIKQLGLADGADTETVIKAIKDQAATSANMPEAVFTALGLAAGASEATVLGAIKGLQAGSGQSGELMARVAELEKAAAKRTADDLVAKALAEGKIAPTQKKWALEFATKDAEGFEGFLQTAPQVVPTTRLGGGGMPSSGGAGGDDAEQAEINKELGISEEDFKKYAPPLKEV